MPAWAPATVTHCGVRCAANPIPLTTQYVLVSNLCPECKAGDLDQEIAGDGRWTIQWYPVQCAVGSTPFVYSFQNSNPYYVKMQVSNHRCAADALSCPWGECPLLSRFGCRGDRCLAPYTGAVYLSSRDGCAVSSVPGNPEPVTLRKLVNCGRPRLLACSYINSI